MVHDGFLKSTLVWSPGAIACGLSFPGEWIQWLKPWLWHLALLMDVCLVNGASDQPGTSYLDRHHKSDYLSLNLIICLTSWVTLGKLLMLLFLYFPIWKVGIMVEHDPRAVLRKMRKHTWKHMCKARTKEPIILLIMMLMLMMMMMVIEWAHPTLHYIKTI